MLFEKYHVPYADTKLFSNLIVDFISNHSDIKPFVRESANLNSIRSSLSLFNKVDRQKLTHIVKEQYDNTVFKNKCLEKVYSNIELLSNENTYTVTTGHQLNLFLSPLFLIYKITSVIAYCKYLNKNIKGKYFVPCFWMATEDHDFNEINSAVFFNKSYLWNSNHKNAVGNLSNKDILPLLKNIEKEISFSKHGKQLYAFYNFAYTNNINYANANRSLLNSFFSDYGLVVIDGNHKGFKKQFINDFKFEVNNQLIFKSIKQTNDKLSQKYKPQINPLHENIFYLHNSIRSKIQFNNKKYYSQEHKEHWSKFDLLNKIELYPERFSPNVFLRTLYQQRIMPNVLYVGGPSEIAYWLQTKKLFTDFRIEYPFLALRSSFLFLSKRMADFKLKHGLSSLDLFNDYDLNAKRIIQKQSNLNFEELLSEADYMLSNMEKKLTKNNDFPMTSFEVFKSRLYKELSKLESKKIKFEKNKNQNLLKKLMTFHNKISPNNSIQEKVFTFIPYYIKYGHDFFELLIKESTIFEDNYTILMAEE